MADHQQLRMLAPPRDARTATPLTLPTATAALIGPMGSIAAGEVGWSSRECGDRVGGAAGVGAGPEERYFLRSPVEPDDASAWTRANPRIPSSASSASDGGELQ